MISPSSRRASATASDVFPVAVGPTMVISFRFIMSRCRGAACCAPARVLMRTRLRAGDLAGDAREGVHLQAGASYQRAASPVPRYELRDVIRRHAPPVEDPHRVRLRPALQRGDLPPDDGDRLIRDLRRRRPAAADRPDGLIGDDEPVWYYGAGA